MDQNAPRSLVEGYEHLIPSLRLPDPDDRHILAAAIASGATSIVTFNDRDFPESILGPFGIVSIRPDVFLCQLFDEQSERFIGTVASLLSTLKNPPMDIETLRTGYLKLGLSELVKRIKVFE